MSEVLFRFKQFSEKPLVNFQAHSGKFYQKDFSFLFNYKLDIILDYYNPMKKWWHDTEAWKLVNFCL